MLAAFQEIKLNCTYTIMELQHTMIKQRFFFSCFTLMLLGINRVFLFGSLVLSLFCLLLFFFFNSFEFVFCCWWCFFSVWGVFFGFFCDFLKDVKGG